MNIHDELRDHIERQTLENIEAGMPPADARAAALRQFGNSLLIAEQARRARTAWPLRFVEPLWQDLIHAARLFAKSPSFVAIAVISIALGTGANIAIFSAADGLVLRPLAVSHPNELVSIGNQGRFNAFRWISASYPDYKDVRARARSFEDIAAYTSVRVGVAIARDTAPEVRFATVVSAN